MALTNDLGVPDDSSLQDFVDQLNAAKAAELGHWNFIPTTIEPEETDSSDMTTYSVVFVPRRPTKPVNPQGETDE
jgi:hypothetical protein